jgi:hypothetical protein
MELRDAVEGFTKRPVSNPNEQLPKICPECGHNFQGHGWGGIDAHWRAHHEDVMAYEIAWPLIRAGEYNARP